MNFLDVKIIHKLEREFEKSGDGLNITQFEGNAGARSTPTTE